MSVKYDKFLDEVREEDAGGGSSAVIKSNDVPVAVVADTPIDVVFAVLSSSFADADYSLQITIYMAGGGRAGYTLDSFDKDGFTITPSASGTMHWTATKA